MRRKLKKQNQKAQTNIPQFYFLNTIIFNFRQKLLPSSSWSYETQYIYFTSMYLVYYSYVTNTFLYFYAVFLYFYIFVFLYSILCIFLLFFFFCSAACGILVPWPRVTLRSMAVKAEWQLLDFQGVPCTLFLMNNIHSDPLFNFIPQAFLKIRNVIMSQRIWFFRQSCFIYLLLLKKLSQVTRPLKVRSCSLNNIGCYLKKDMYFR